MSLDAQSSPDCSPPRPQVLKVHLLGHRKRIIASLADRPYEEPPQKPPRFSQLRVSGAGGEGGACALCCQELKRIL